MPARPGSSSRTACAYSLPEWKATGNLNYRTAASPAFLQGRYIGDGTTQNSGLVEGVNIESNASIPRSMSTWRLELRLGARRGRRARGFGQVTNLFDEDPPITPYYSAFLGYSQQYNPSLFDVLGRRYTLGFRLTM